MEQWKGPSRFDVVVNLLFILQVLFGAVYGVLFGPFLGIDALWYIGWVVLVIGFLFFYLALQEFKKKGEAKEGTSVQFTTVLVNSGVYAIVRHPQGLGCFILMTGSILTSQHWFSAIIGIPISAYWYSTVPNDEAALIEKFGDDYKRYMQKVPRLNFIVGIIRLLWNKKKE